MAGVAGDVLGPTSSFIPFPDAQPGVRRPARRKRQGKTGPHPVRAGPSERGPARTGYAAQCKCKRTEHPRTANSVPRPLDGVGAQVRGNRPHLADWQRASVPRSNSMPRHGSIAPLGPRARSQPRRNPATIGARTQLPRLLPGDRARHSHREKGGSCGLTRPERRITSRQEIDDVDHDTSPHPRHR